MKKSQVMTKRVGKINGKLQQQEVLIYASHQSPLKMFFQISRKFLNKVSIKSFPLAP